MTTGKHGITRDEYIRDAAIYATRGTDRPNARLNPGLVRWIRCNPEGITRAEMAERLGVHLRTVDAAANRKTWGHIYE